MPTKEELKMMQNMTLYGKVMMTKVRIREWVRHWGEENVCISFSGGKDSTVLMHIVREEFPNMPAVFVNTGLEYPEIQEFAKSFDNVTVAYPNIGFKDVIVKYGYPILSKVISHNISVARRNPNGRVMKNIFSEDKKGVYAMHKWLPVTKADFLVSEKCCDVIKKAPFNKKGKYPFVATLACESKNRRDNWMKYGCNMFDANHPKSNPMSFWTENDVLQYIYENNIEICSVYGDISVQGGNWHLIIQIANSAQQVANEPAVFSADTVAIWKKVKHDSSG